MMHGHEKSDPAIVAMKPANKAEPIVERSAGEPYADRSTMGSEIGRAHV